MNVLLTKTLGRFRYVVYLDEDGLNDARQGLNFDFGSSTENDDYQRQFMNGDMSVYGITRQCECPECGSFRVTDSLWGIDACSPQEALAHYLVMDF